MSVRVSALQLKDMRDKVYLPSSVSVFHGGGHRLGGQSCPSRLLPSPLNVDHRPHCKDHSQMLEMQGRTTSELPGKAVVSVLCVCIQYVLSGSIMCLLMTCVSSNDAPLHTHVCREASISGHFFKTPSSQGAEEWQSHQCPLRH